MKFVHDGGLRLGRWVIGASAILGATLLAGRLTGLLRELELAALFGVSRQGDLAVLLLTLPDLLVNLLLSGGLSAALVPRLKALPRDDAMRLFRQAAASVLAVFAAAAAIVLVWPSGFFALLAPGLPAAALPALGVLAMTVLAIPLTALSGVTTALLNAHQQFLVAGCGTLLFNLMVLTGLWIGPGTATPLFWLAAGIAAGASLRLLSQVLVLPGGAWAGPTRPLHPDRPFVRAFAAAAGAASLILLVPVLVRAMASTVGPGSIATLNYAFKLVELPAGVLVGTITSVALVRLSEHHGAADTAGAARELCTGLQRAFFNAAAVCMIGLVFVDSFVGLLLGRGAMGADDLSRVTTLTRIVLVGLPFGAIAGMVMADLNARQRPQVVMRVTAGCLMSLPLLALPGLLRDSEGWLAAAVVGFQVAHAAWLSRAAGVETLGDRGWLNGRMRRCLLLGAVLAGAVFVIDRGLGLEHDAARVVLALIGLLATLTLSQRLLGATRGGLRNRP